MEESNLEYTRWASLPLLAEAYLKLGRTEDARKVVTRMEKMISDAASKEAAPPDSPAKRPKQGKRSGAMEESDADRALAQALHRAEAFRWKARIAEAEKHPADAWTYYRAGLLVMPAAEQQSREELEEDARRLWKKLGGTEEGWRTALERTPSEAHASVQEASGWEEKNLPLPDFEITDLSGRRWTRADLKGKVIFINVWATWCGPCQGELPHLQKLHEKLRGRSDVQLLTFNIDSNPGIVEPYITKRGYTFPTLPAEPYVLKFMGHVGIPRNWIVDRKGTLVSEQVGFGNQDDEQWAKEIVAQLDKVLASP